MKTCVLYSGGKDSSLMAVILQKLGYPVELVTLNFGVFNSFKPASQSAASLGFKHNVLDADTKIIEKATNIILNDGFPNNGINYIHKEALDIVSDIYDVVADGTRRDDRVPMLKDGEISSIENRKNIEYINLRGFGHKTINCLSQNIFQVKKEQSNMENNSDYEIEIRYLINKVKGKNKTDEIFPAHLQSRVIGWKNQI
jgi:predicted subunit of tRNA(5-methylaminomethyl-2-thiouridylate) methyltransferase